MTLTKPVITGTTQSFIQSILSEIEDPIIFDLFSDGGKQSIMMHDFCNARGQNTLSIAVSQNEDSRNGALLDYPNRFSPAFSLNEVAKKHQREKISYFIDPSSDFNRMGGLTEASKADFILCEADFSTMDSSTIDAITNMLSLKRNGKLLIADLQRRIGIKDSTKHANFSLLTRNP